MTPEQLTALIIGISLFIIIIGGIVFMLAYTMPIAEKLYRKQWTRNNDESFKRGCSAPEIAFHFDMYNQGMAFREANLSRIKEVEIESLGVRLVGEYYDFGFKKAIILLPGRTETCYYGAYYAEAFKNGGYNVMLIDPRAHGLSGGDKITLGKEEGIDALNWAKFLHDKLANETIALYGLCGGATAACVALTNPDCPKYINAFIADGMFYSFYRVYKRHIRDEKHFIYPVVWEVLAKVKKNNNVNPYTLTPSNLIKKVKVPSLLLAGEFDKFSLPKETQLLLNKCGSSDKKMVLINNARHSHLRYDNKSSYDETVTTFLKTH